jgi:hypothetical protein
LLGLITFPGLLQGISQQGVVAGHVIAEIGHAREIARQLLAERECPPAGRQCGFGVTEPEKGPGQVGEVVPQEGAPLLVIRVGLERGLLVRDGSFQESTALLGVTLATVIQQGQIVQVASDCAPESGIVRLLHFDLLLNR